MLLTWGSSQGLNSLFNSAEFILPLTTDYVLSRGTGSATYTRATVATVFDNESVLRNVLSGEARFQGARRVYNLITLPTETITAGAGWTVANGTCVSGVSDPNGGTAASTITATSANAITYKGISGSASNTYTTSVFIRRRTGTGTVTIVGPDGSTIVDITSSISTTWRRFSITGAGGATTFAHTARVATIGDAVDVAFPMLENVTGQSNQAPAEYVSVGVLSTPFHGAGVDGVKYLSTTNGNSVASNVVTEASGSPISASTLLGYLAEGAGTQLVTPTASIRDMTNAAWVKGATMTAALTGTGIDGVANSCSRLTGGAVAATNTAFQTLVAAATSRTYSCYIKRVTGTGTINITQNGGTGYTDITSQINSSTFTKVSLNASVLNAAFGIQIVTSGDVILVDFNQFESGTFATSPMASAGAVRNADVLTYPSSGNVLNATGTAYAEIYIPSINASASVDILSTQTSRTEAIYLAGGGFLQIQDGSLQIAANPALTVSAATQTKVANAWGGVTVTLARNGTANPGASAFDGSMNFGASIYVGCRDDGREMFGTIRNVRIYSAQLSAAQLSAVTA